MAIVEILFRGDAAGAERAAKAAGDAVRGIGAAANEAQSGISGLVTGLGGLAAVGVAAVGSAVLGIGAAAVNVAGEFDAAQRQMQAQLGITSEQANALSDVARDVFGNNFGGSVAEASGAVAELEQRLGLLGSEGPEALQAASQSALALRDVFGIEVAESAAAAQTLVNEFGISSAEAFDLLASGFQQGLNSSGDFLDSIGEYSNLFAENGAGADEFFSLLQTGMAGGALGTDKAADAFKEFGIRITDGSKTTAAALASLGLDDLTQQLSDGTITAADAFSIVQDALRGVEDPLAQVQTGVALFGTQFEDLGASAVLGINMAETSMAQLGGAADSLNVKYGSFGDMFSTIWRQILLAIEPIGAVILDLGNQAMPFITAAIGSAVPVIQEFAAGFGEIVARIGEFITGGIAQLSGVALPFDAWAVATAVFNGALSAGQSFISTYGGLISSVFSQISGIVSSVIGTVSGIIQTQGPAALATWQGAFTLAQGTISGVMTAMQGVISSVLGVVAGFWATNGESIASTAIGAFTQIGAIVSTVMQLIQATVIPIMGGIAAFITANSGTIVAVLSSAWTIISTVVTTALGIVQGVVTAVLAAVQGDWSGAFNALSGVTSTIMSGIGTIVTSGMDLVRNAITVAWNGIVTIASSLGGNLVQGIISGIGGAAGKLMDTMRNLANSALDAAKKALGIASPSKRAGAEVAVPIVEGIDLDLKRGEQTLADTMRQLADTLMAAPRERAMATGNGGAGQSIGLTMNNFGDMRSDSDIDFLASRVVKRIRMAT